MQKKLIALAVAALASSAAFAQVTVYGVADGTFDMIKVSGSVNSANDVGRFSRVSANSSLFGLKGSEDLGGGMSAIFQFESSVGFDATGGTLAARDSYVGLTGGFGKVALGNLTGPTRAFGAGVDVFAGATGIGANTALIGKLRQGQSTNGADSTITLNAACGRSSTCASIFDNRWKNTIAYTSPAFGPVTVIAAYVSDENQSADGAAPVDTKGYDLGVKFDQGPVMVGLSRNWATLGNATDTETAVTRLVAKYNFGIGDVRALYDIVTLETNAGVDDERNIFGIGATFNVGSGKIVGQYYKTDDLDTAAGTRTDTGATLIAIGYEHSLSKRTMLKATYSRVTNLNAAATVPGADQANFDFGVNASGLVTNGANVSGMSFGVRHTF